MANTGNIFPGSGTSVARGTNTDWTNPGNIVSNNTTDATCASGATGSDYLRASSFGFSLPTGATILGVTVRVEASEHSAGTESLNAQLVNASGALFGSSKAATVSGTAKAVYTYGSTSDLWGATITEAIVEDTDFGVQLWFTTTHDVRIDYVTIAIEYRLEADGSSTGAAVVTGVAGAVGATVGASTGVATASGVSGAQALAEANSTGASAASGVGSGIVEATGSATGAATTSGDGSAYIGAVGASDGSAATSGQAAQFFLALAASVAIAVVSGIGSGFALADGSSSGIASTTGDSISIAGAVMASTGTATVSGDGEAVASGSVGSSTGTASVTGQAGVIVTATASAGGTAVSTGAGAGTTETVGASVGSATVNGVGEAAPPSGVVEATGVASGSATVTGTTARILSAGGQAVGSAVLNGTTEFVSALTDKANGLLGTYAVIEHLPTYGLRTQVATATTYELLPELTVFVKGVAA